MDESLLGSEQLEVGCVVLSKVVERDLDAVDAATARVDLGLRLDAGRDEHAPGRGEPGVPVEPLLVADQLLDSGDLADALDLDRYRPTLAVAAQQVDRADVGRVLAPHQRE